MLHTMSLTAHVRVARQASEATCNLEIAYKQLTEATAMLARTTRRMSSLRLMLLPSMGTREIFTMMGTWTTESLRAAAADVLWAKIRRPAKEARGLGGLLMLSS